MLLFSCQFCEIVRYLFVVPGIASGYCASPVSLVDGDCFSATATLAAFCSALDGTTCMPEPWPSTQTWLRNSVSPYLLKVTSLWARGVSEVVTANSTKTKCERLASSI